MKSTAESDQQSIAMPDSEVAPLVNDALDQSVASLSDSVLSDIAQARNAALAAAQINSQKTPLAQLLASSFPRVALPVAAAVIIGVSVQYNSVESVPALPLAMVTSEIPNEALTLLEDLEFVTWLAENEPEALL